MIFIITISKLSVFLPGKSQTAGLDLRENERKLQETLSENEYLLNRERTLTVYPSHGCGCIFLQYCNITK